MSEANVADARPLSQLLRMAVIAGVESAVQVHINRGDNLNARDASGMTPLMLSAARNKPAICRLLLSAGADHGLLDPSGKTALEIAIAAGSNDTAAILGAVAAPPPRPPAPVRESGPVAVIELPVDSRVAAETATNAESAGPPEPDAGDAAPERQSVAPCPLAVEMDNGKEFDLSGWEADEEAAPPEADLAVLGSASAIQSTITSHEPIDSSAGWDDVDAYLPQQSIPLPRADDAEFRAKLRRLLLRAIREGSVPSLDVQALSTSDDRSANPEAEAFLAMIVNDLGAEIDERFEYANANERFEVFVDPEESPDEEVALDGALDAIDDATSPRHEPLRIYQREFQQMRLLTAEDEVELAQAMEAALDAALDALAGWPEGIARTLAAGTEVMAGSRPLSSMWLGDAEPGPEHASVEATNVDTSGTNIAEDAMDEDGEPIAGAPAEAEVGDAAFANALARLSTLAAGNEGQPPGFREIRDTLGALRINRRFLLELGGAADASAPCESFGRSLSAFRMARDRMTAANLKLAFFHAKKFMRSGEPLDDLAQEANIGLIKAVDRFEWRLGYRFSTYATWWIRQQIGRHLADRARTIRVPVHVHEKVQRLERETEAFETAFGREPTVDELASRMDMPAEKITALRRIAPEPSPTHELPIDEMVAADARDTFAEPDPAEVVEAAELRAAVDRMLLTLPHRDAQILRLRFGIGINDILTLDEIGQRYAVTRERVRQIEAKALRKLRHPEIAEPFARLALGIKPAPQHPESVAEDSENAKNAETADHVAEPKEQYPNAPPRGLRAPNASTSALKPTTPDRLFVRAPDLGIPVEEGRWNSSRRI